jgi:cyclic beta-1,2-glucan synthetase
VPLSDPVKISRLKVSNRSGRARRLSITAYAEWVLGTSRGASAPFIVTEIDAANGAILARNPWNTDFPGRIAFSDLAGQQTAWTADRTEFIGRNGALEAPVALTHGAVLTGTVGAGLGPCAALATSIKLGAGETTEVVWLFGQCGSVEEARTLISRIREADIDTLLASVADHWETLLGAVRVKTPDRAINLMLNGWLLYQTLACRVLARSAFCQASGAYGFRDQLQDTIALSFAAG